MTNNAHGYRGYIGSRAYSGLDLPQNVQNFLIRSYCQKNQFTFLLSGTEYRMPGCYMILEEIMSTIDTLEGIVLFSIFMLPESAAKRKRIYAAILNAGKSLHAALEDLSLRQESDIQRFEDILQLNKIALTDTSMPELREFCYA
jgi:sporadic carbohydrate cluster protein (TIGR04323 family)